MNNNHNIKDLDLLYIDAKRLINDIVNGKFDDDVLRNIDRVISEINKNWHGKDAVVQINKIIDNENLLIENREIVGNIGVYISMLAKNYRDAQNYNSPVLPSFLQLDYKKIPKKERQDNSDTSTVYMNNNLTNAVNILNNVLVSLEDISTAALTIKTSILDNWIQEDDNRAYAIKVFMRFDSNMTTIINSFKEIVKNINTSIDNYNESNKAIETMPSLESLFQTSNVSNELTHEEQKALDSIKRNFDSNKKLSDSFNRVLVNEVKKDLTDEGVL